MGYRRVTHFAILMGTVFAKMNAGAIVVEDLDQTNNGLRHEIPSNSGKEEARDFQMPGVAEGAPLQVIMESSLRWSDRPEHTTPRLGSTSSLNTPPSTFDLRTSPHPGASSPSSIATFRTKSPALQISDLSAWKSTEVNPSADPEDWLFRLQYSDDTPTPEPPFPIPEPASGTLLVIGGLGMAVRRYFTRVPQSR